MGRWGSKPVLFVVPRSEGAEESGFSGDVKNLDPSLFSGGQWLLNIYVSIGCGVSECGAQTLGCWHYSRFGLTGN
jgi:hypothetical protein